MKRIYKYQRSDRNRATSSTSIAVLLKCSDDCHDHHHHPCP